MSDKLINSRIGFQLVDDQGNPYQNTRMSSVSPTAVATIGLFRTAVKALFWDLLSAVDTDALQVFENMSALRNGQELVNMDATHLSRAGGSDGPLLVRVPSALRRALNGRGMLVCWG
jgi:hypothetical protein